MVISSSSEQDSDYEGEGDDKWRKDKGKGWGQETEDIFDRKQFAKRNDIENDSDLEDLY